MIIAEAVQFMTALFESYLVSPTGKLRPGPLRKQNHMSLHQGICITANTRYGGC